MGGAYLDVSLGGLGVEFGGEEVFGFTECGFHACGVLAACGGEEGLAAAAALDELGDVAYGGAGVEVQFLDEVVGDDYEELWFVVGDAAEDDHSFVVLATELEGEVFELVGEDRFDFGDDEVTVGEGFGFLFKVLLLDGEHACHHVVGALLKFGVGLYELLDALAYVFGAFEGLAEVFEGLDEVVDHFFGLVGCHGLDTAHAGGNGGLGYNLEETDASGGGHVCAAAELD